MNDTSQTQTGSKKTKWPLIFLLLIFVVPFAFAYYYFKTQDVREFKRMNHGELIQPAKDIKTLNLSDLETHEAIQGDDFKGHWWIWYVSPDKCLQECHDNLYNIRQVISSLGKESSRVMSVFLSLPDCQVQACEKFVLEHYPNLKQAQLESSMFNTFFEGISDPIDRERIGEIYISDPRGYAILKYSGEIDHKLILKDLKRLLKVSQIG